MADSGGVEHRLGVVTLISRVENADGIDSGEGTGAPQPPAIEGLGRFEIGNAVWLVILNDGARILLTQRLHVWQVDGRSVNKTTHAWNQVVRCRVGENFAYESAGGDRVVMGDVVKLLLVES